MAWHRPPLVEPVRVSLRPRWHELVRVAGDWAFVFGSVALSCRREVGESGSVHASKTERREALLPQRVPELSSGDLTSRRAWADFLPVDRTAATAGREEQGDATDDPRAALHGANGTTPADQVP